MLFIKHPDKYVKLMKIEGHYKYNNDFWQYFTKGCGSINEQIPINIMLKDTVIKKYIPEELKVLKK